jgi:hypothetical protein
MWSIQTVKNWWQPKNWIEKILWIIGSIVIFGSFITILALYFSGWIPSRGPSMQPTLPYIGAFCKVDDSDTPQVGQIIYFRAPNDGKRCFKRLHQVCEDGYLVRADNRDETGEDSDHYGIVPDDNIIGTVTDILSLRRIKQTKTQRWLELNVGPVENHLGTQMTNNHLLVYNIDYWMVIDQNSLSITLSGMGNVIPSPDKSLLLNITNDNQARVMDLAGKTTSSVNNIESEYGYIWLHEIAYAIDSSGNVWRLDHKTEPTKIATVPGANELTVVDGELAARKINPVMPPTTATKQNSTRFTTMGQVSPIK